MTSATPLAAPLRVVLVDAEVQPCLRALSGRTHQVIVVGDVGTRRDRPEAVQGPAVVGRTPEGVVVVGGAFTPGGVTRHLGSLMRTLSTRSRTALRAAAVRLGVSP